MTITDSVKGDFRMRTFRTIATAASLALAFGGGLFAAANAQAATASSASLVHSGGELWYKAGAGQANKLTVSAKVVDSDPSEFGSEYLLTFRDQFDITLSADECSYPTASDHTVAQCTVPAPEGSDDSDIYDVDLGDGNDTATVTGSAYTSVYGGKGNDVLKGSRAAVLYGDAGDDRLDGGGGVWALGPFGGAGNDTITNCDAECHGGTGNDSLTGTSSGQEFGLYGDDGNDLVHGGSGADLISGGKGNDKLYGDSGNDKIYGNSGNDILHGGTGRDTLSGGAGVDKVYAN